jgi:hypothetical protein
LTWLGFRGLGWAKLAERGMAILQGVMVFIELKCFVHEHFGLYDMHIRRKRMNLARSLKCKVDLIIRLFS